MKALAIQDVRVTIGGNAILQGINLSVAPAEFISLLGPSGCGKTTLLRCIAGLQQVTEGTISAFGQDITTTPPSGRDFGMVFQSLALFPHLNILDNVTFPLRRQRINRSDRQRRGMELLELVRLSHLADRSLAQVSGGQAQRVALARALAQEPRVLLLDEPFSALDAQLREELRTEVRIIQKSLNLPVIMVTHDQDEALTISDRVGVMKDGQIEQYGSPDELFSKPASAFVANFVGQRNHLICDYQDGHLQQSGTALRISCQNTPAALEQNTAYDVFYTPDAVTRHGDIVADVLFAKKIGAVEQVCAKLGEDIIWLDNIWSGEETAQLKFGLDINKCHLFPRQEPRV